MREIKLTQGKVAIVDDEDFDWLNQWKWFYTNGYAVRWSRIRPKKGVFIYMHRQILDTPEGKLTDHINRNRLDNRRSNLRAVSYRVSLLNRGKITNSTSQYRGVNYDKTNNKWQATVSKNNKMYNIGRFRTERQAAMARDIAIKDLHGKFAILNFPTAIY